MSSEPIKVKTTDSRSRSQLGTRRREARGVALRRAVLDTMALEPRTLMATLPPSLFSGTSLVDRSGTGNMSTPSIAIDQNNPQKLVAAWTLNDPTFAPGPTEVVRVAFSNDGGATWQPNGSPGGFVGDPSTTNPTVIFQQAFNASVGFDRNDNAYVLYEQSNVSAASAAPNNGALLLSKYNFTGATPARTLTNNVVYEWNGNDGALFPTMTVDDTVANFSDVGTDGVTRVQSNPYAGNVYVAWETNDTIPSLQTPNIANFNPNRIKIVASSDGGQTFSIQQTLNTNNDNFAGGKETTPRIAVSQGRAPGTNGPTDRGVTPGTTSVVWDDYYSGRNANPPFDEIHGNSVTKTFSQTFTSAGGGIQDAGPGTPNSPATTDFPVTVNVSDPRFLSLSNINVSVAIFHPAVAELNVQLVPPPGSGLSPITLVANQTDAAGTANTGLGISGANMGISVSGNAIGTVFDDEATRNIFDSTNTGTNANAAPYVGHFRAEGGSLNALYAGATAGAANSPNSVNGTWTLRVTDFRNGNAGFVANWKLILTSGMTTTGDNFITTSFVRAQQPGNQTGSAATPLGIAPDPVIASDNTLGAYSPHSGRLYLAYVDKSVAQSAFQNNPADNTDIFLVTSDDGGQTWTTSNTPVNDDLAIKDGYSEAGYFTNNQFQQVTGRPQFSPSITVDQSTGTLVMSWYDTRDDSAKARVATYLTTSIDGGQTFSPDVYANDPQTATDAITGKVVNLTPVPDNASVEPTVGFGYHIGLAAYGGHAYPIWSSNNNGGNFTGPPIKLGIVTNTATYAAGPRIIATTQGPIGGPNDNVNTTTAADGTPLASAFQVVFDRPVDPSTFTPSDVQVKYTDTTPSNLTGGFVPVSSVVPLDNGPFGATTFLVNFAPRSGVGTYSLAITSASIRDSIRTAKLALAPAGPTSNLVSTDVPKSIPPLTTVVSNLVVSGYPANQVVDGLTVNVSIASAVASSLSLSLVAPDGTAVLLARFEPFFGAGGQNYTNTTFDDRSTIPISQGFAPFTGTFRPESPLSTFNTHSINGVWQLKVRSVRGNGLTSTITGWSIGLTPGSVSTVVSPGNRLDQNSNGIPGEPSDFLAAPSPISTNVPYSPFVGPFQSGTLPLILPGPHIAFTALPGVAATADNLVLDKAVSAIDVTFDRDMDPSTVTAASVLRIVSPIGTVNGPFTITANPLGSDPDPAHPRTYRVGFTAQKLSGTYTVTLASTITDRHGNALDTNLNAGVDLLKGVVNGPTNPVQYPAVVGNGAIGGGKTIVSTLNISDNYLVQGLMLQLNITDNNDPNLQITLVSPNNIPIILVPRGSGTSGTKSNFTDTIFDDAAASLIQNGAPPFFGRFKPLQPLSAFNGISTQGTWKLIVDDDPTKPNITAGRLNSWSLTFQKGVPSSGLGDPVSDQATASFRIFNTSVTNHLASNTWTGVGPASMVDVASGVGATNGFAGRIDTLAIDPSDPSGNTVYVGASSGGIWKTVNFLTSSPQGPTYVPLTDFGPTSAINIGSIAIFARNNDPRQSIIVAGTGDPNVPAYPGAGSSVGAIQPDNTYTGVGFLISKDGGATWTLSSSATFAPDGGTRVFKVVVDPRPTASGQVIMYAAVGDNAPNVGANVPSRNGLWRSDDTGQTWTKYNSGVGGFDVPATDVILDYNSGTIDAVSNPTGNINTIYVAFPGNGVYSSPNRGNQLNHLTGGNALPLVFDNIAQRQVPVNNNVAPTGNPNLVSRIILAKPAVLPNSAPNADVENTLYQGWLYAYVDGTLFLTKDYGQTWTQVKISTLPDKNLIPNAAVPTNDPTQPDYNPVFSQQFTHNHNLALAVDATNPAIVYLGGTANGKDSGFLRVDTTRIFDSHAFVSYDGTRPGGGALQIATTGRSQVDNAIFGPSEFIGTSGTFGAAGPYINLIQDPTTPFLTNATVFVQNVASETNDGSGTRWIPIDEMLKSKATDFVPSSNVHTIVPFLDPVTGATRLIVGDDQGVFTGVLDAKGTIIPGVGNATSATYSRNGNLQIAQFLYGASQPSNTLLNQQVASALYLANGYNLGQVGSDPNILADGNLVGRGSTNGSTLGVIALTSADQMGTGVAVDQQGKNIVFRYLWPEFGGDVTDFFQVSLDGGQTFVSRTFGLVQSANDPQWPSESANYGNGLTFGNFTINPINSDQIVISSAFGRVFSTINQGKNWSVIAEPGQGALDGSYAPALTYGAPDPSAPGGIGNLNNFIYAGTVNGNIYVTRIGGGTWTITNPDGGLDGSPVMKIVADPTRGSHAAYAVTQKGVYYTADSIAGGTAAWQNVTGTLFSIANPGFKGGFGSAPYLNYLTSIAADWRYAIPNATVNGVSTGTHPMIYVSGEAGVFRTIDNGTTWTLFPNQAIDGAPADGGYLPNAQVTDLTLSLGKIDPTTGRPIAVPGDSDTLLATTFGRGQFSIRVAPVVFPASVALDPKLPLPTGSVAGKDTATGLPLVTIAQPYFDGLSEATSIGNRVRITLLDLTIPGNPRIIGGFDPSNSATDIAANWTDAAGKFAVQVNANGFSTNGTKTIGIQATDLAGVVGNPATITFVLNAKLNQQGQPPTIPTIGLNPLDDTSGGLKITKVTNPRIIGVTDAGVQVQLFNASNLNTPLATGFADALGNYSLQYPTSPAGTYSVVVIATNANGTAKSATLTFTIKTNAPTNPATLTLDPNDDTGIKGDRVTTVRFPHFIGVTDPGNKVSLYKFDTVLNARGPILATTTADNTGHYSIQLPFSLADGSITLQAGITDIAGNAGPFSTSLAVTIVTTNADYIGDGKTDPALFRRTNMAGALWFIQGVPPAAGIPFGGSNLDVPFTGDFDGNGTADLAVYRPSTNTWYLQLPSGAVSYVLGTPGSVPVVGNFDGNFITETAAFVPSTGVWTINSSIGSTRTVTFPAGAFTPDPTDIPVPGDYEGTGIDELAVYRPASHQFIINENTGVVAVTLATTGAGDIPVPGNYDDSISLNPVHRTLPAVFNPTSGQWLIAGIAGNRTVQFNPGDVPAPGDYSGAGVTQTVVYRAGPGTPAFYGPNSTTIIQAIGKAGDIPVTAPLVYRNIVTNAPTLALSPGSDTGIVGDNVTSARQPIFNGKTDPNTLVDLIDAQGNVLNTVTSDNTGAFNIAPASALKNGSYAFQARAHGIVSSSGPTSKVVGVTLVTVDGDYTGVGKTSVAVFRRTDPFLMQWFVQGYAPLLPKNFGAGSLDVPLSGDFNGDGKADPAVYRPSTADWYYADSTANYAGKLLASHFGFAGVDLPVPGNYNGTGVASVAVFRPTTGEWFVQGAGSSTIIVSPKVGDIPVPGNYDNTGSDEFAIFRPSTGQWIVSGPAGSYTMSLGQAGDVPVPGAYDATATSRATEIAVFRPSTGQYIIHGPAGNRTLQFNVGDIPAPGDYDGTGVTEAAVFRPSTANWYVMGANDAKPRLITPNGFGYPNHDVPPNTPYQYRALKSGGGTISQFGEVAIAPPAVSTTTAPPVSVPVTNGLTPPPATPPTTISSHPRHRPSQNHVAKTHSQSLIKHPLLAANRLPSVALTNAKKSPGVKN